MREFFALATRLAIFASHCSARCFWWLFDFFGLRAVWLRAFPHRDAKTFAASRPRTFFLWVVGVYTALFGIASARYESALDRIEERTNGIYSLLGAGRIGAGIGRVPHAQAMLRPRHPNVKWPPSVVESLFRPLERDGPSVKALRELVESFREDLGGSGQRGVVLSGADLSAAELSGANFERGSFVRTNFKQANLEAANMKWATLTRADLRFARLGEADLTEADLSMADFRNALFRLARHVNRIQMADGELIAGHPSPLAGSTGTLSMLRANLRGSDLRGVVGLPCEVLTSAQNWETTYRDPDLACGGRIVNSSSVFSTTGK